MVQDFHGSCGLVFTPTQPPRSPDQGDGLPEEFSEKKRRVRSPWGTPCAGKLHEQELRTHLRPQDLAEGIGLDRKEKEKEG